MNQLLLKYNNNNQNFNKIIKFFIEFNIFNNIINFEKYIDFNKIYNNIILILILIKFLIIQY